MNYNSALKILELEDVYDINIQIIKKKYKLLALQYHPDKNQNEDASNKFIEIQQAYEYLLENSFENINETSSYKTKQNHINYKDILIQFLKSIIEDPDNLSNIIFYNIFHKITQTCEYTSLEFLKKINKEILIKIYDILYKYNNVFKISEDYVNKVKAIIEDRIKNDERIILHPTIEDLLYQNVYKLTIEDKTIYVPLWHHEILYEINGNDIYIYCIPILPDDYDIDSNNNLIIDLKYNIHELLDSSELNINIVKNKTCIIQVNKLKIKKRQKIEFIGTGIPQINDDIYNISKLSNIIFDITLY